MITSEKLMGLFDTHMGGAFKWGSSDCLSGCSKVFEECFDLDPAYRVRGGYRTEEEARTLLGPYGGSLMTLMSVSCNSLGLKQGEADPPLGAIGLSPKELAIGLDGRCASIYFGRGLWVSKAFRGYAFSAKAEVFWYA